MVQSTLGDCHGGAVSHSRLPWCNRPLVVKSAMADWLPPKQSTKADCLRRRVNSAEDD
nr:hypothetical protein Itr_chr15CG13380 [Ipomoea trifida]